MAPARPLSLVWAAVNRMTAESKRFNNQHADSHHDDDGWDDAGDVDDVDVDIDVDVDVDVDVEC